MVGLGYGSSCSSRPFCGNELIPTQKPYLINMLHRLISLFIGILIIYTIIKGLKIYKKQTSKKNLQNLYDFIFKQIELSIREIGYGDATVNKKMKEYVNLMYSIVVISLIGNFGLG